MAVAACAAQVPDFRAAAAQAPDAHDDPEAARGKALCDE
jgi:hypothetical protein